MYTNITENDRKLRPLVLRQLAGSGTRLNCSAVKWDTWAQKCFLECPAADKAGHQVGQ